jgi:hypothetical protein
MQMVRKIEFAVALVWALIGGQTVLAGDGIRSIDSCATLEAQSNSSFVLVNNIFSSGQDCLVVNSSNITINLNGFSIVGSGSGTGIVATSPVEGVTVRNGFVKGFALGISLGGPGNLVEEVHVDNNTDTGMFLGTNSLVYHVIAQGNFNNGIIVTTAGTIKDSVLRFNGDNPTSVGLSAGPGSTVTGNTISGSIGTGLFASLGSTVIGNSVSDSNPGVGMSILCPSNVKNNTATANTSANLVLTGDGCNSVDNVAP